jgi:hypothetical protein
MLANAANPWTRCLLFGTQRTYFRGITPVKASNQRSEIGELSQSAWKRKRIGSIEKSVKGVSVGAEKTDWTSQVTSSQRSYASAIVVVVSVIVKVPSNKPASFKPQLH